jgi:hypothetical protein
MPFLSEAAPTQGLPTFDEYLVHGDSAAEPGMPRITDLPPLSIMCVELSTSIIVSEIIRDLGTTSSTVLIEGAADGSDDVRALAAY